MTHPSDQCTCRWYGVTIPGEPQIGTMFEAEPDPLCPEHFPPRWKLACINWTSPAGVPRAAIYLLLGGKAVMTRYWPNWADAVAWLNAHGTLLDLWAEQLRRLERERSES